jgi:hypothetical protein
MTAALFRSPNSLMRTSVSSYVQAAIRTIEPVDSPASLESEGVRVVSGDLSFAGPHSARVGNETIDFSQAVICTGSTPVVPPISGLAESAPLTSDSVWDLREMPQRLAILGGGNIGCELGQAFARLGSQVTIVEGAHRILPREDAAAAGLVARALCRDGAVIHTGSAVTAVKSAPGSGVLVLEDGTTVDFDQEAFDRLTPPLWERLREVAPSLWRGGQTYPRDSVALDKLFARGEVDLTMTYGPATLTELVSDGTFPRTTRVLTLEEGTVGNASFLAIPTTSPGQAGAMVVADLALSPEQQRIKAAPEVWGQFTVLDESRLSAQERAAFADLPRSPVVPPYAELARNANPELSSAWVPALDEGWRRHVLAAVQ